MTALLELNNVRKVYQRRSMLRGADPVVAVDGVSLAINEGETLGVVGESGSGKSTLGKMIVRLEEPASGNICFDGWDISQARGSSARSYAAQVQMIFQDPYSSLNPYKTIGSTLARPLILHGKLSAKGDLIDRSAELLQRAGLNPGSKYLDRYPHQLSGGERQRVAIARALSVGPKLVVADEPVSSLDVSVRAQILRLLRKLQDELGIAFFFITHDLAVLPAISHRIAVVYKGRIVELGKTADVIGSSGHPYTAELLAAMPIADPAAARARPRQARSASPGASRTGCTFATRCPWSTAGCREHSPPLIDYNGRLIACFPERQAAMRSSSS